MKLLSIFIRRKGFTQRHFFQKKSGAGFTLIEVLIVIAIFSLLAGFGLLISMDFWRSYSFSSERTIAVSVLQKARTQSMINLDQAPHGVRIDSTGYTIFEGASYVPGALLNEVITKQPAIAITCTLSPCDIIFGQLSGTSTPSTVTISDGQRSANITINNEGRIDW